MTPGRFALGAALALSATLAIVALSQLPWRAGPENEALLRLSWRAAGERIEKCRAPSEADLAGLPPHMQPKEICEGRTLPFQLTLRVDGATLFDAEVRPAGARADRPAYVLEEFPVAPGPHRVEVRFAVSREQGAAAGATSPPLLLDETLTLGARDVVLVTRGEAGLEIRRGRRAG